MSNDSHSRPFFHHAISQLSTEYSNATTEEIRKLVIRELEQRQSQSARNLLSDIRGGRIPKGSVEPIKQNEGRNESTNDFTRRKVEPEAATATYNGSLRLTKEQLHAVDLFKTGSSLRINAFAGTGKTTTLQAMAQTRGEPGVYLAFNRAIADDARQKFPRNVKCQTVHSLAYAFARGQLKREDKLSDSVNTNLILRTLSIKPFFCNDLQITQNQIAGCIATTLRQFFYSADYDLSTKHFRPTGFLLFIRKEELQELSHLIVEGAKTLWYRMIKPEDPLPLGHDGYLKYWALCRPEIPAKFILLDEAQDTNPVVLEVLRQQRCQVVFVGDRYQQIYEWRGAVNAMEYANANHDAYLTESFRFGPEIARTANKILHRLQETRSIVGVGGKSLRSKTSRAIISRTNAALVDALIEQLNAGEKPYLEGGASELKRLLLAIQQIIFGRPSDLPELFGFRDWKSFVSFANSDQGLEYRTIVRLIGRYTIDKLLDAVDQSEETEESATITLSTTHRAKGREWDDVYLADDFKRPEKDMSGSEILNLQEELRIAYVAVTRARRNLRIPDSMASWL
jgi:superfamily I DNA/RNA helicase